MSFGSGFGGSHKSPPKGNFNPKPGDMDKSIGKGSKIDKPRRKERGMNKGRGK